MINQRLLYEGKEYVLWGWITEHEDYIDFFRRNKILDQIEYIHRFCEGTARLFSVESDKKFKLGVPLSEVSIVFEKVYKVVYRLT